MENLGGIGVIGGFRQSPKFLEQSINELKEHLEDKNSGPFGVDLLIPQIGAQNKCTFRILKSHLYSNPQCFNIV